MSFRQKPVSNPRRSETNKSSHKIIIDLWPEYFGIRYGYRNHGNIGKILYSDTLYHTIGNARFTFDNIIQTENMNCFQTL